MRGTGKTKAMVDGLPASGSAVIVHSAEMRAYVRRMIGDLRGSEVVGVTTIFVIDRRGEETKIDGVRKPIYIDHAFLERSKPDVVAKVRRAQAGINMMFEKRA